MEDKWSVEASGRIAMRYMLAKQGIITISKEEEHEIALYAAEWAARQKVKDEALVKNG